MPTILRVGGLRLFFYSNEGFPPEPPHVHAAEGRLRAKFWLDPVRLAKNGGFAAHRLTQLVDLIEDNKDMIRGAWNEHIG